MTVGRHRRPAEPSRLGRIARIGMAALAVASVTLAATGANANAAAAGAFQAQRTLTRTHLVDGKDVTVDTRHFSLTVDRTTELRDRDGIQVSWSGAHPTGGLAFDVNSADAVQEEYPVVLLECRGVDSTSAPAASQLRPETCFTQSPQERYLQDGTTTQPPWRLDRYATAADRGIKVDAPATLPKGCPSTGANVGQRYVPFVSVTGTKYLVGSRGCAGIPPEMATTSTLGLPSNSTYAITALDGKGSVRFDVRTAEDNASLGCGQSVPCALVVVPIMGVSCDVGGTQLTDTIPVADDRTYADDRCKATGHFAPGQFDTEPLNQDVSVSGQMWWTASNWRQRITVPLTFAPPSNVCDITGGGAPIYFYGSELAVQATTAWAPEFCTRLANPFKHVQTGEPQARNLFLSRSVQAALVSRPPDDGWGRPTVMAPVALTGFTIAFTVDGVDHNPVSQLRLTPRLLAKLLTESYPALPVVKSQHPGFANNPLNISDDPEFRAYNPGLRVDVPTTEAASSLLALSSDSDVMHALTAYINADPEARAFLNGTADPWGMAVNPAYKGIKLPVDSWPLLDTFEPTPALNPCLASDPVPYLPLVAAPTQRLASIALDLQYAISPSQVVCQITGNSDIGDKLAPIGRQNGGFHFLLGVMSLADARRYGVSTASLLSAKSSTAPTKPTDRTGRTFVAPTDTALRAAAGLLREDGTDKTWLSDPAALRTAATGATAYPGTMLVSAALPTDGLSKPSAARYAEWLRYVIGAGQTPGEGIGQLPAGYLPLTAADGLGAQATYAGLAATAVARQQGEVPGLHDTSLGSAGTTSPRSVPAVSTPTGLADGPVPPAPSVPSLPTGPAVQAGGRPPVVAPVAILPSARTSTVVLGLLRDAVPVAVLVGLLAVGVAVGTAGGIGRPGAGRRRAGLIRAGGG